MMLKSSSLALRLARAASVSSAEALSLGTRFSAPAVATQMQAHSMSTAAAAPQPKMFCFQCEQTANGKGCSVIGQCGKTPEVAGLQDLLVFTLKGLGTLAAHARTQGISDPETDSFCLRGAFSTLTNVNFDDARMQEYITESVVHHNNLLAKLKAAGKPLPTVPHTAWFESETGHPLQWNETVGKRIAAGEQLGLEELCDVSKKTGILHRQEALGATTAGLQELIMYGLKGTCAYAAHAEALGGTDPAIYEDVQKTYAFLSSPDAADINKLLGHALHVGETNFKVMQLLSETHTKRFGIPTPTEVSLVPVPGKAILITGHDMEDLYQLLKQTEGKGINVYTHGEMLPAHGYPELKKFKHLAGHYGGAWYRQKMDFASFPGAVIATTNCVLEPMAMYRKNLFTTNETGLANVTHIPDKDYTPVINRALELQGWNERNMPRTSAMGSSAGRGGASAAKSDAPAPKKALTVGFGHHAVLGVADKVIDAVQQGKLKHIFLVGGCDGHEPQRNYYSGLGTNLPKDTLLLTLGCGKFRLLDQDFGTLADTGLPRLLDMGQCNDAYSALVVATELAKAFKTDVNSLPLSLDISWFEQKAVAVLLTLLSLGVKNIRLGPVLPAFLTQDALNVLVEKFALKPADTSNPDLDLVKMMAKA